jgi:hypothetical protein
MERQGNRRRASLTRHRPALRHLQHQKLHPQRQLGRVPKARQPQLHLQAKQRRRQVKQRRQPQPLPSRQQLNPRHPWLLRHLRRLHPSRRASRVRSQYVLQSSSPSPEYLFTLFVRERQEEMIALKQPCRFCSRLTDQEACSECQQHHRTYGHFPTQVHWQQVPGQPRVVTRVCGECARDLLLQNEAL